MKQPVFNQRVRNKMKLWWALNSVSFLYAALTMLTNHSHIWSTNQFIDLLRKITSVVMIVPKYLLTACSYLFVGPDGIRDYGFLKNDESLPVLILTVLTSIVTNYLLTRIFMKRTNLRFFRKSFAHNRILLFFVIGLLLYLVVTRS